MTKIAQEAYVVYVKTYEWDDWSRDYSLTTLYRVVYKGKSLGNWGKSGDITPIELGGKVKGFLKTGKWRAGGNCYFFIDLEGHGPDTWVGCEVGSSPHFRNYRVKGNILTLWGDEAKTPEDLKKDRSIPEEEKSIYEVDLRTGQVIYDPFVPVD